MDSDLRGRRGQREANKFPFFFLFKRSILGVGWNLSVFSCSVLLRSVVYHPFFTIPLLPIVSGLLVMVSVSHVEWRRDHGVLVWRSGQALILNVKVSIRGRCLCLL